MKKILAVFAALFLMGAMATPAMAGEDVTFCHDTNGPNQVEITTDIHGWQNGHEKHIGTNVQGHDNDKLGPCPVPPPPDGPTPPATPPATPEPPAGPPAPPTDFCPNLDGVQWENYDCNTPQVVEVVPTPEATPVPTVEPTPAPAETPVAIPVPDKPTVPKAVPAGDGSSQGSSWVEVLAGFLIGVVIFALGFATARLTSSK
jgi:hypothetical protein